MEKKVKTNYSLIVILVLIILGLGGYVLYDKFYIKSDNVSKENENTNVEDSKIEETRVYDPEIISKLTNIVDLLVNNENGLNNIEEWTIYTDLNLSDRTKLFIALNNSLEFLRDALESEIDNYDKVLSESSLKYVYENIWGEEIKSFEDFQGCPQYEYSKEKQVYHVTWRCGDVYNDQLLSYISKVTEMDGVYYLYQSIGMVDHIDDDFNWSGKFYDSVDMKNVVEEADSAESFEITKDNYTKFSEYRFAFKLDNGTYKITKIERIK